MKILYNFNSAESSELQLKYFLLDKNDIWIIKSFTCQIFPIQYQENYYNLLFSSDFYYNILISKQNTHTGIASFRAKNKHAYLLSLGILPNYRCSGIGKAVLKELENFIFGELECNEIHLNVQSSNLKALNFYIKSGYTVKNIIHNYYEDTKDSSAYLMFKNSGQRNDEFF